MSSNYPAASAPSAPSQQTAGGYNPPQYSYASPNPQQNPPQYAQYGQAQPAQAVVVSAQPVQQVMVMGSAYLPPGPCTLTCPNCHQTVTTRVVERDGLCVWASCAALALIGCWLCCCIPFCIPECKDVDHVCPSCGVLLGRRAPL